MSVLVALLSALSLDVAAVHDEPDVDCNNPTTTLEMNHCAARQQQEVETQLKTYLDAAYAKLRAEAEAPEAVITEIKASQTLWENYTEAACGAVYTHWQSGSIRNLMAASCRMELMRERSHHIWREYLAGTEDDDAETYPEPQRAVYKSAEEHSH